MGNRVDVSSIANATVGRETRGVISTGDGVPVLATPAAALVLTAVPAVTATPTITRLGGYMPDIDAAVPEASVATGASAEELIKARLSA